MLYNTVFIKTAISGMSCNNINNIIPIDDDNEIFYSVEKLTCNNDDIIF